MSQVVGLPNNSYKLITNTASIRARLCKLQRGCTRLAAASDKAQQLLAHGRWFSPGTPASSTTKTGRHDIAEILMKAALNIKNHQNIIISIRMNIEGSNTSVSTTLKYIFQVRRANVIYVCVLCVFIFPMFYDFRLDLFLRCGVLSFFLVL